MENDVWSRLGITPYAADPSKIKNVSLKLDNDPPSPPVKQAPKLPSGTVFTQDGFIPDVLRTMGDTGLNYMNLGANALNAAGADIDTSKLINAINATRTAQDESDARTMSPIRKAETDKIKAQLSNAHGVIENVIAGGEAGLDMLLHPIENSGKIVGGLADPTNFIPGVAGAKIASKLGGGVLTRVGAGAAAGAVSNAPINAIEEGAFAASRGEDWEKSAAAGFGGGIVGGTIIGGVAGGLSRPRFASDKVIPKVTDHIAGHEASHTTLMENDLMRSPDGEKFDSNVDIGFSRDSESIAQDSNTIAKQPNIMDHPADTIAPVDHQAVFNQVIGEHLDSARAEGDAVYAKAMEFTQSKASPDQMKAFIDNAITPSHDDLSISDLVNNGDPLPSRFTGMRIVDVLERNIKIAEVNPAIAKTNIDLSNALKKEGFSKELNNAFTKAYAAKDPSILTEYIIGKSQPLSEDIRAQLDEHFASYKAQAQQQKANAWDAAVPPDAVNLVGHPKFLEHLDDRRNVSANDARYAQTRTSDLVLSHENNGQGYETIIQQPAAFDRNYAYDFELTKKDISDIEAGRWSEPLVQKLRNDLDRYDNDPLYNPKKDSIKIANDSNILSPSLKLHQEMTAAMGVDHANANAALISARAKAMGITTDEFIQRTGVRVEDMRDISGRDFIDAQAQAERMFQNDPNVKQPLKSMSDTVIMKDILSVDHALKNGKIDAVYDRSMPGWVSEAELGHVGETIRKSYPYIEGDARVYEYKNNHGDMFRVIVDRDGVRMHSDRADGAGNESVSYDFSTAKGALPKSLSQIQPDLKLSESQINGMVELGFKNTGEMKNTIYLFKSADASTLPHELMHIFERTFSDVERSAVDDLYSNIEAGVQRSEAIARDFEKFLATGDAPTPELHSVFDKFREWLIKLFKNTDLDMSEAHRELYRAILGDREAAAKLSDRYEGIVNEKIAAEAEVLFQKSSIDSRNALQKMNDAYDGIIDGVDGAITRFARGVDKAGDVIIREPSEYPKIDKAINILDWVRESFITNGRKSDTLVDMAKSFDNVRGYLSDEAKALRDILTQYDKVKIVDPLQTANLLEQDAPPRMTTHGALLVRALGGDLPLSMLPESMHVVYAQMRKVIDDNTKALIDAGELSPEHAKENYLKRYYMEHITNKNLGSGKITQTGKHARSELDLDTRLDMGQIEDAAFVITRTMLDQRLQLEKAMHFKKMADKFGIDEARAGYEQISKKTADDGKTPLYGALAGKYVPKFVADDIRGAYEVGSWVDSIVKGLAVPVDFIKVTQTVKNPGTHVYNVTSNTYIAYMDGHLTDLAEIAMMIKNNPQKFREITRAASKEGLNGMGVDLEKSILKANTDGKSLTVIKNLLLAQDSKGGEFVRNAYDWEDKIFKLAKFYSEMKKNGGKLDDASAKQYMNEVHKIYVDHSKPVPKFIRNMDKSGLSPFLSYMWRSAPQVAYVTLKHPLRFAAFHAVLAPFGASAIWNAISGDEEDETGKPKYMKEGGFNMMGTENFFKTGTDENGYDNYINLGRAAPGMRFIPDKGNPLLLYSDGGFTTDIIRTAFTGEDNRGTVYNKYDSNTEQIIKMTAAIAEYVLPPALPIPAIPIIVGDKIGDGGTKQLEKDGTVKQETVSIGGRYAQKLNQALMGKRDTYGQPVTVSDVLSQAVGMKVTRIDPEVEKEKRYKEWMPEVKRAINEGDMERAKEYADKIKELDLPEKKRGEKDPKKEALKTQKKDMDSQLQKLGLQKKAKSSLGFTLPRIGPSALRLPND